MAEARTNYIIQKRLTIVTVTLFAIKIAAWIITHSIAVLTDALEYTINVIAGFISLYSLFISAQPKDQNHPYGHGKAEFLSAAVEAILMIFSSLLIIYEAINNFVHPHLILKLDVGIFLISLTAMANYVVGYYAVKTGKKTHALNLIATGKHMQTDTYGTVGVIAGLVVLYFTHYLWIDSLISLIFAFLIILTGYKILRSSVAGIMDEADAELLKDLVEYLSDHRKEDWMDLHNLRIIKYGSVLHVDCHLTIPYYFTIEAGHRQVKDLEEMVKGSFGKTVEMFVHMDGCIFEQCSLCFKNNCPVRKHEFIKKVHWTTLNVAANHKHTSI
ncbi:MAG: cation diffusion facilitator family transporter [Flavisolibacter sp.]